MSYRVKEKHENRIYNGSVDHRGQNSKNESCRRKSPLRVQNDWSEHVSSKGFIYYYNCKTEVSQWQRPTEWSLPQMTPDEIKKCLSRSKNGENIHLKRNSTGNHCENSGESYSKRFKHDNNSDISNDRKNSILNNPNYSKPIVNSKPSNKTQNIPYVPASNLNKTCKFNDDDMDISPGSSPLSAGSNSDCDKKVNNQIIVNNSRNCENKKSNDQSSINNLTPYQVSLVSSLRSVMSSIKSSNHNSEYSRSHSAENNSACQNHTCLSVYQISDLLMRIDTVSHNGDTCNSYRSHRLQAQMSADASINGATHHNPEQKPSNIKSQPASLIQVKESIKTLQKFLHDRHPNAYNPYLSYSVSPTYNKSSNRLLHYLQILLSLIETCLNQLCPQSLNSPSSTSSPGSLKDNSSNVSVSTSVISAPGHDILQGSKNEPDNPPIKREKIEEKPKSILQDSLMLKYVSTDVTNTYSNAFADCCEKEAQSEYYKFVKFHSVFYSDLACESKKLKALVRISEIKTELLRQKKEDLEKLIQVLDSRRLPNHLRSDYYPNS